MVLRPEVVPAIHPPARLRLMGIANSLEAIEFAGLRDRLEVSDSVLSKHLAALVAEGYLSTEKKRHGGPRRTWVSITEQGAEALEAHVAALRAIAAGE